MSGLREQLAEEISKHTIHLGWNDSGWNVECLNTACRFSASGDGGVHHGSVAFAGHVADALLASGLVVDASTLADDGALVGRLREYDHGLDSRLWRRALRALAVALAERSPHA